MTAGQWKDAEEASEKSFGGTAKFRICPVRDRRSQRKARRCCSDIRGIPALPQCLAARGFHAPPGGACPGMAGPAPGINVVRHIGAADESGCARVFSPYSPSGHWVTLVAEYPVWGDERSRASDSTESRVFELPSISANYRSVAQSTTFSRGATCSNALSCVTRTAWAAMACEAISRSIADRLLPAADKRARKFA